MSLDKELAEAIDGVRAMLDRLEERLSRGEADPVEARETLIKVVGALMSHGRPPQTSKKPFRGYGYTFDEALIVASLPEHDNSLPAAVRAHYPKHNPEWIESVTKRIRRRRKELQDIGEDVDF
jgi:hypothetical protein